MFPEWIADIPRVVGISSGSNETGVTFTITGRNHLGDVVTEDVTGPNATTANSTTLFRAITSIAISGAATGAITVGTTGEVNTPWIPLNLHQTPFNVGMTIELADSPTVTYNVQHTLDDVQDLSVTPTALNHEDLNSKTTTDDGNYAFPIRAMRLNMTGFTAGTVQFGYAQAGLSN